MEALGETGVRMTRSQDSRETPIGREETSSLIEVPDGEERLRRETLSWTLSGALLSRSSSATAASEKRSTGGSL